MILYGHVVRILAPVLLLLATAASAKDRGPDPCAPAPLLFISPVGEPFRAPFGSPYPSTTWFDAADADHDGRLTLAEFLADGDRFFATVDTDHDGQIVPTEMSTYEFSVPELSTYASLPPLKRPGQARKRDYDYSEPIGAGRFGLLNVPHPLAQGDTDYNRALSRDEFHVAARATFARLATGDAILRASLPLTPQQQSLAACAAEAAKKKR